MGRLSNGEAARNWAGYNEYRDRKMRGASNSIKYEGRLLFSYRACIGCYYGTEGKNPYVLFATSRWGVTTAGHINKARCVVGNKVPQFTVPNVDGFGVFTSYHQENMAHLLRELNECMRIATHGYKVRWSVDNYVGDSDKLPMHFENAISRAYAEMVSYSQLTKTKLPKGFGTMQSWLDEATRVRNDKWRIYNDPKAVANRERRAARADAKLALFGDMK